MKMNLILDTTSRTRRSRKKKGKTSWIHFLLMLIMLRVRRRFVLVPSSSKKKCLSIDPESSKPKPPSRKKLKPHAILNIKATQRGPCTEHWFRGMKKSRKGLRSSSGPINNTRTSTSAFGLRRGYLKPASVEMVDSASHMNTNVYPSPNCQVDMVSKRRSEWHHKP
ncbi:hypothetical protein VNO77_03152 [Canavalia gladiata]|uniref:Uncharacterized protein n=1 Tax=Canavalia gladiata TaxID=3824 RepID=A0AAN9RBY4_CANGL